MAKNVSANVGNPQAVQPVAGHLGVAVEEHHVPAGMQAHALVRRGHEAGVGRVGEVLVKQGDVVKAGQVLARLETEDLDLALAQAETALVISQAQLERLKTPTDEIDLAAAE